MIAVLDPIYINTSITNDTWSMISMPAPYLNESYIVTILPVNDAGSGTSSNYTILCYYEDLLVANPSEREYYQLIGLLITFDKIYYYLIVITIVISLIVFGIIITGKYKIH